MDSLKVTGNLEWDGLHRPQIYYAMVAIFSGLFLSVIDGSICNVALPSISKELQVSSSDSIWIVNGFQLVVMMFLLPFSSLGELKGFKQVYLTGLVVFLLGSLCCTFSVTLIQLVLSRMLQGLGAAMVMSVNGSLVRLIYPEKHLPKGFGLNAMVVALAAVTGPTLAAAILAVASWPWLFAINIPVGLVTFCFAWKYLPDNPTRIEGRRFDYRSACLNVLTFGFFIGTLEAYAHGAALTWVLGGLALLVVIGTFFVRQQLIQSYPMLPFDLLRIPVFSLSVMTSICSFTSQMLAMVSIPFLLHHSFGFDAVRTGLFMTALPLVIVFASPVAGFLVGRIHAGLLGALGLLVMSSGCFLLSFMPVSAPQVLLIAGLMLCGLGFGLFQSPNNHLLLSSAPAHRCGGASGMQATARLVGQTAGATLVTLLHHITPDSVPHNALLLAGILTLVGACFSGSRIKATSKHF